MNLSSEEKQQAIDLAKGMLMAQRDSVSLAGNIINNPHFSSVPHKVKMEALRQYAQMEDSGEYKTTVNMAPDRKAMARETAKAALREGSYSLPLAAVLAVTGNYDRLKLGKTKTHAGDAIARASKRGSKLIPRFAKSLAPLAGTLFAANAITGGAREYLRQRSLVEEAQTANKYLDKIRGDSTDADINAMLFASQARRNASQAAIKKRLDDIDYFAGKNENVVTYRDLAEPAETRPSMWLTEQGELMDKEITKQSSDASPKPLKTSKKSWAPKPTLKNIATAPEVKATAAKIRKDQMKNYEKSLNKGLSDDPDAAFRMARAAAKKLLRM